MKQVIDRSILLVYFITLSVMQIENIFFNFFVNLNFLKNSKVNFWHHFTTVFLNFRVAPQVGVVWNSNAVLIYNMQCI